MGMRILAIVLRALFIGALVAVTVRVSSPQSESLASVYETPGDLIRLALGFAVCLWIVIHMFMLPRTAEGYRISDLPRLCGRPARVGGRHYYLVMQPRRPHLTERKFPGVGVSAFSAAADDVMNNDGLSEAPHPWAELRSRARVRACARYGVLVVGEEMKGSRTLLRKVLPEREREGAAVPEAIERLISRGPPAGSGIPFEAWRSWHRYGSLPVRPRSFGIPVPTIAAGWALIAASWMGH